jgi:pimeloyl-ACP methyl ester carboxylesterase
MWILLRGLTREHRHWGDFPQRLAEGLGARVICLDLPGNGTRHGETSPWHLRDTLPALRHELDGGKPLNLLGLSMGGMIATEWALRHPREVGALVLINCSLGQFSPPWQRLRPAALGPLARALFATTAGREALILRLTCARRDDRDYTLSAWRAFAADCPVRRANFLRQVVAAARHRSGPATPRAPTLILCARGDKLVAHRCSEAIASHWGAVLAVHPWAGHDLAHDDPDWLLARIRQWRR